jgi:riboflavin kinase/FMN adenylyltransferase
LHVFREFKKNLLESSSLALGVFDGVHLGHKKVILNAVNKAKEFDASSAVVTFSKPPRSVLLKSHPQMLISLEERLELIEQLGVDAVLVLDFNEQLASMPAKDYLETILIGSLNAKNLTIGYNHKFGGDKAGNSKFLGENSNIYGYKVDVISPFKLDNHVVSSSAVRKFLTKGDVVSAKLFLGREFKVKGKVIHGQHLGRTLGFPTANLSLPEELIIPQVGVYGGTVVIDEKKYTAVINVGKRPTIGDLKKELVEVHILDFNQDIYDKIIDVSFSTRLREEKKFASLDELKLQIKSDCDLVKQAEN